MHNLLSSYGLAVLTLLGIAAVLALVLVVLVEIRCLVRLTARIGADPEEPRFFADVGPHHDRP